MSRFSRVVPAAVGSYGFYAPDGNQRLYGPSYHVEGSSFNLEIKATNFLASNVGSNWRSLTGQITAGGMFEVPGQPYGALVIQVNSLVDSGGVVVAWGL